MYKVRLAPPFATWRWIRLSPGLWQEILLYRLSPVILLASSQTDIPCMWMEARWPEPGKKLYKSKSDRESAGKVSNSTDACAYNLFWTSKKRRQDDRTSLCLRLYSLSNFKKAQARWQNLPTCAFTLFWTSRKRRQNGKTHWCLRLKLSFKAAVQEKRLERIPRLELTFQNCHAGERARFGRNFPYSTHFFELSCGGKSEIRKNSPYSTHFFELSCGGKSEIRKNSPYSTHFFELSCWGNSKIGRNSPYRTHFFCWQGTDMYHNFWQETGLRVTGDGPVSHFSVV